MDTGENLAQPKAKWRTDLYSGGDDSDAPFRIGDRVKSDFSRRDRDVVRTVTMVARRPHFQSGWAISADAGAEGEPRKARTGLTDIDARWFYTENVDWNYVDAQNQRAYEENVVQSDNGSVLVKAHSDYTNWPDGRQAPTPLVPFDEARKMATPPEQQPWHYRTAAGDAPPDAASTT